MENTWTEKEVLQFYRNSLRFQTYGLNMEHYLNEQGYLPKGTDLNTAINNFCEKLNVSPEIKNYMHIIRKNRNLGVHESITELNKDEVLGVDYYDTEQVEGYQKYQEKAENLVNAFKIKDEDSDEEQKFNKKNNQNKNSKQKEFKMEYDPLDEKEMWKRKEVKQFYRNSLRFQTYGMNMEHFLQEIGVLSKVQEGEKIFGGIQLYCEMFNVPQNVKSNMHKIRMNRNLASHEGTTKFKKQDVTNLNYYDLNEVEGYTKYYGYALRVVRKWKIYVKQKQGKSQKQILQELKEERMAKICKKGKKCRNNNCDKEHPEGKFCALGKNCRNRGCHYNHSNEYDIFVSGLPGDSSQEEVQGFFEENAGQSTYCKYICKNGKGLAFLTFENENAYLNAMDLNQNSDYFGRRIWVKHSNK